MFALLLLELATMLTSKDSSKKLQEKNVYNTSNLEELSNWFIDILTETCSE